MFADDLDQLQLQCGFVMVHYSLSNATEVMNYDHRQQMRFVSTAMICVDILEFFLWESYYGDEQTGTGVVQVMTATLICPTGAAGLLSPG